MIWANKYTLVIIASVIGFANPLVHEIQPSDKEEIGLRASNMSRQFLGNEVIAAIKEMKKYTPISLIVLYDKTNQDTAMSITHQETSAEGVVGTSAFENSDKLPNWLLLMSTTEAPGVKVVVVLCSPANIISLFQMIQRQRLKSHLFKWLIYQASHQGPQSETILKLQDLVFEGTEVMIINQESSGALSTYSLYVDLEGNTRFKKNAIQVNKRGNKASPLQDLVMPQKIARSNFQGRRMVVAVNDLWPYFGMEKVLPDGTIKPQEGIDVSILKALSRALNFTYKVVRAIDKKWGNVQADGTVTGFIGMVARREANFAITTISITDKRATVVDFTFPYYREPLALFSRTPKQRNRALAIFAPFTFQVWCGIILSTLIMGPILYAFSQALPMSTDQENLRPGLQTFSFNAFRNIVIQGNLIGTNRWPLRCLFFFWYIFCLTISATYSGMLTAVLAIPAYETPFDSLEDLPRAVENGFTLGVMEDSSHEYLFKEADDGIYKRTWELFNHDDRSQSFIDNPKTGVTRVLNMDFVFIGPKTITEILAMREGMSLFHVGKGIFFTANIAVACPQGAPYRTDFSKLIIRMTEGGLITKWKADEIRKIPQVKIDSKEVGSKISAITLKHLQAAFAMVVIGFALAAIILALENLGWHLCPRQEK